MKIGVIILARTNFGRWPDKILFPLCGKPIFEWVIEKCMDLEIPVIVSTTENIEDQIIIDTAIAHGAIVSIGNPDNRTDRYAQAILENKLDCFIAPSPAAPFFDIEYTKILIQHIREYPEEDGYFIGRFTSAVPGAINVKAFFKNMNNENSDKDLFYVPSGGKHHVVFKWYDPALKNRYLFEYNIAFKLQAHAHEKICEYLGHFPKNYDEIRKALMGIE